MIEFMDFWSAGMSDTSVPELCVCLFVCYGCGMPESPLPLNPGQGSNSPGTIHKGEQAEQLPLLGFLVIVIHVIQARRKGGGL